MDPVARLPRPCPMSTAEVRRLVRPRSHFREYWSPFCPQDGRHCRILFEPKTGLKRVAWPPPPEDQDCVDFVEKSPVQAKTRGEYITYESSPSSGGSPHSPVTIGTLPRGSPQASSPSPISPSGTLRQPSHFHQQQQPVKTWAPVTPPATSPLPYQQSPLQQYNTRPQQTQQLQQQPWKQNSFDSYNHSTPKEKQPESITVYHQPTFAPPPSLITLRPQPPISQAPAPVYQAQPAATMAPISGNMRGDTKWPPESVKAQTEAENRARLELAKGPAVRPRRVHKDYSGFFAQHALNSTYPGYRAPPGTQYFSPSYQH
ncbi:leucine-rich repeat extensin-like protein 5 isoform X2 [Venturia canescens]|uniref:leucine-rich repeat extensin-like protein 5 isoform X2 n=1 Tax=Venturia canescens TaxID=32260 RepID=UPI001C9C3CCF|nr:leucine-rich repeat extensin-like protein 5 isoform X2 [Venturia canescens]